jgi:hypothetical protein
VSGVLPCRALLPGFRTAKLRAWSTGPSWSCPARAPTGAELELSGARAHQRAELDAATMAATLARTSGAELEVSGVGATGDARAPSGPRCNCPT